MTEQFTLEGINAEAYLPKANAIKFMAWRLKKLQNTTSGFNVTVQCRSVQYSSVQYNTAAGRRR